MPLQRWRWWMTVIQRIDQCAAGRLRLFHPQPTERQPPVIVRHKPRLGHN